MSKRAIVLAGGKGTRLRPFTFVLPKPLVPVGEMPILEILVRQLVRDGFKRITMAVNHQADIIRAFFGDGSRWHIDIDYVLETEPLGTMGPLGLVPDLPGNFLVMNGDVLTDMNFDAFLREHVRERNTFTVAACQREQKTDFGILEIGQNGRLSGFREKPVHRYYVSMGVYAVNRKILSDIPAGRPFGFDELMLRLIRQGRPAGVRKFTGYWLDIGRPEDYERACAEAGRIVKACKA